MDSGVIKIPVTVDNKTFVDHCLQMNWGWISKIELPLNDFILNPAMFEHLNVVVNSDILTIQNIQSVIPAHIEKRKLSFDFILNNYTKESHKSLATLLCNCNIRYSELFFDMSPNFSCKEFIVIVSNNPLISAFHIGNANEVTKSDLESLSNISFYKKSVLDLFVPPKSIDERAHYLSLSNYFASFLFDVSSRFNVFVDENWNVRKHMHSEIIYGNLNDHNLSDILNCELFAKHTTICRDLIFECSNCDRRNVCLARVEPIMENDNYRLSKKCSYYDDNHQ